MGKLIACGQVSGWQLAYVVGILDNSQEEKHLIFTSLFRLRVFFGCHASEENMPGFLCPDHSGFLGITETHFLESLTSVLDCSNSNFR